ncbi:MAG: beta-N-acetylhexosaminidase [Paraprevotella sp.]|nr:beta-N-acetylhexosaminidase [Paraprevotella sp.]
MKRVYVIILCLCMACAARTQGILLPTVASLQESGGSVELSGKVKTVCHGPYAGKLGKEFRNEWRQTGMCKTTKEKKTVVMFLQSPEGTMPDEAYTLDIGNDTIVLCASSESGLFYAKEVLLQMIRYGKGRLDVCRIHDNPRFAWRGFMLDESRHFFGKEKVKQYLDIMASLRMNVFHWHLTDEPGWRIEIKRYPKLTTIGATGNWHDPKAEPRFYTQEDIREIVAYAAERHIMVVPEFDMPGHASALCRAYPEVSGGGKGRWEGFTFHPCKEETFELIGNILDEIVTLFPAPYIHIGGDEVHYGNQSWYTDPEIQNFIRDNQLGDETGLEHYFVRRAADLIASKGKTMIGWDEIVDAGVSPQKAVVMWWRHDRRQQLVKALEKGYRVIMTPRRPMYGDFIQLPSHRVGRRDGVNLLENVYSFPEPVMNLAQGHEHQLLGIQYSVWTERIADGKRLDYMVFPRLFAVAEAAWALPHRKSYAAFLEKLAYYLDRMKKDGMHPFDPFNPDATPEPSAPDQEDVLKNG